jgi:hypothetical protein
MVRVNEVDRRHAADQQSTSKALAESGGSVGDRAALATRGSLRPKTRSHRAVPAQAARTAPRPRAGFSAHEFDRVLTAPAGPKQAYFNVEPRRRSLPWIVTHCSMPPIVTKLCSSIGPEFVVFCAEASTVPTKNPKTIASGRVALIRKGFSLFAVPTRSTRESTDWFQRIAMHEIATDPFSRSIASAIDQRR